jgi:hypothetical protein
MYVGEDGERPLTGLQSRGAMRRRPLGLATPIRGLDGALGADALPVHELFPVLARLHALLAVPGGSGRAAVIARLRRAHEIMAGGAAVERGLGAAEEPLSVVATSKVPLILAEGGNSARSIADLDAGAAHARPAVRIAVSDLLAGDLRVGAHLVNQDVLLVHPSVEGNGLQEQGDEAWGERGGLHGDGSG